jgi:hypothetical protein
LYCQQQTVPEISWSVSIQASLTTKAGTCRLLRKSFPIYKAEKASPSNGALALVSSLIYLATSMATLMPALPISNLIHFRAWATFSSSTTAL